MKSSLNHGPVKGATARIEPLGETIDLKPGEILMSGARRAGLLWPTLCHGSALCGVCYVEIIRASDPLPAPSEKEKKTLRTIPAHVRGPNTRLACQLKPSGMLTVRRVGVARPTALLNG